MKRNPTGVPRDQPLLVADAGAAAVVAPAGLAVEVAADAGAGAADAGAAGLVGRNSGPFCPQPASNAAPSNSSDMWTA